jgi:ABC-type transport system substrate-binding protein
LKKLIVIILILTAGVLTLENRIKSQNSIYTYVITDTPVYRSLDPLDADQSVNLLVARMLYSTPMDINAEGELQSSLFNKYEYNDETQTMLWKLKSGLKYSDGSTLTAEDVAFSVSRMIYTRPKFPVIEDILGVDEWLKEKSPLATLPSGINIDGNTIKIQFSKKQKHPLFRFCLEIFSVIPKKCVDTATNKLNCPIVPYSGHYKLVDQKENEVYFEKRQDYFGNDLKVPEKIVFKYMLPAEAFKNLKNFDQNTVIAGNEIRYSVEDMKTIRNLLTVKYMPTSRMAAVTLNSHVGAFKDVHCRQYFAQSYRKTYEKMAQGSRKIESSFVTDLLPGFINKPELESLLGSELTPEVIAQCKDKFNKDPIYWSKAPEGQKSLFAEIMSQVFDEMGVRKTEPIITETQEIEDDLFMKGKIAAISFQTGFWALDPVGDIQMLLTPNMHEVLNFVTEDEKLQSEIRKLKMDTNEESYKEVNRYIFKQAIFNVFTHVRRFYASNNKSLLAEAPVSVTSPAPWQVFKMD